MSTKNLVEALKEAKDCAIECGVYDSEVERVLSGAFAELEAIRKAATALMEVPNDPAAPGAIKRWQEAMRLMVAIAKEAGNG